MLIKYTEPLDGRECTLPMHEVLSEKVRNSLIHEGALLTSLLVEGGEDLRIDLTTPGVLRLSIAVGYGVLRMVEAAAENIADFPEHGRLRHADFRNVFFAGRQSDHIDAYLRARDERMR